MRTAEGGAEFTRLVDVDDGLHALQELQARGFSLLATSSHASLALGRSPLPERVVVLFGSEGEGLSPRLMGLADDTVAIPGSGALESLNVACASSVVLWELWKGSQRARAQAPAPAPPPFLSRAGEPHAPSSAPSRSSRPPRGTPPPRPGKPPRRRGV
jgi:tRNA(Leu) C34 or U34 (ribose-2'-O)-methylase TrmL